MSQKSIFEGKKKEVRSALTVYEFSTSKVMSKSRGRTMRPRWNQNGLMKTNIGTNLEGGRSCQLKQEY